MRYRNQGKTCKIIGCTSPAYLREWCTLHYQRWQRHGDPEIIVVAENKGRTCSVAECEISAYMRTWCRKHYRRWLKHGDLETNLRRGDNITYGGAHLRVRAVRGSATEQRCVDCGGQATEWSLEHVASIRLVGNNMGRSAEFSPDPMDYSARCHPCHMNYDQAESVMTGGP
jgi:hypothetical protein